MTALFVTGTGTDIGKTFVTTGLIRHFRARGRDVEAIKPVVTGFDAQDWQASDPALLLAALGRPATLAEVERIAPWRFNAPLSPDMAAQREGRAIAFDEVVAFCRQSMASRRGVLLVEGIGGIMVPLDATHTVLDLITALRLPLILVAGSYLGTISHTLTAVDALYRRGMRILSIIVSETAGSTVPLDDTVAAIARFAEPVIGLPRRHPAEAGLGGDGREARPAGRIPALDRIFGPPRESQPPGQSGPTREPRR
jgi:dethiobiotin synthetase